MRANESVEESGPRSSMSNPCMNCNKKDESIHQLLKENKRFQNLLKDASTNMALKEQETNSRITELNHNYKESLEEMRKLLYNQREIGSKWKNEMEILTNRFENKLKNLSNENKELRDEIERMKKLVETKDKEVMESKEMMGIYSARVTRLKREYKKLKEEDEESYIELTF